MSLLDQASWVMVPSQYKEDTVRAFKPTSELGNLAFTRSSDATFTDSTGVVRRSPWNLVQQSEMFSNVAWTKINSTISVDTTVAPNGTLTADALTDNTTSGLHSVSQNLTLIAGNYTFSFYAKPSSLTRIGILTNSAINPQLATNTQIFDLLNGTVVNSVSGVTASISDAGNGWYRCSATFPSGNAAAPIHIGAIKGTSSAYVGTGESLFIWGAQLVEGTEALPYFATTDRLNVPRLDYRNADGTLSTCPRLLLEPQRTNSIRNSSMVGAVAGSPGTLPTNWSQSGGGGLTTTISLGTENGLPYVDIRYNGTATQTFLELRFEPNNSIAASNGQTWTMSQYIKAISGTIPASSQQIFERNSAGVFIAAGQVAFVATSTLQRFTFTRTLVGGATVAFVQSLIDFRLTSGTAYDFTIRIAAPQMELGAYATTWVPTTTTAVTRIADAFTRNNIYTNGLISSAGGTWFVGLSNNLAFTRDSNNGLLIGTSSNPFSGDNFFIAAWLTTSRLVILKRAAGVSTALYITNTDTVKIAIKWNGTTADVFVNGIKQVSATAFTATSLENLVATVGQAFQINQMALAPTPLSDAECIALTTL